MVAVADDFPDMGPLRADVHHSRPVRLATPYTVADFHRLPSAGLPAHPDHPKYTAHGFPSPRGLIVKFLH